MKVRIRARGYLLHMHLKVEAVRKGGEFKNFCSIYDKTIFRLC